MTSNINISVIIPCYNSLKFIKDAIDSVLNSGWRNVEIIVVDDGSAEPVKPFLKENYPQLPNLYCIHQENRGLSGARNTGIRHSRGEYLVFLDADDILLPDKLQVQLEYLRANPATDIVYSLSEWFEHRDPNKILPVRFPVYEGDILQHLLFGNFIHVNSILVPKKMVQEQQGFDESLRELEDWDLWLRLAIAGKRFACIPQVLSRVRVHAGSMTSNQAKMNSTMVRVLLKNKAAILEQGNHRPGLQKAFYIALLNFCLLAGEGKTLGRIFLEAVRVLGLKFVFPGIKILLKLIRSLFITPVNQTTKELEHVWKDKRTVG